MKNCLNREIYNFKHNNNIYQLSIEIDEADIQFTINKLSNSIDYYFTNKINIKILLDKLDLNISKFSDSNKLLSLFGQIYQRNNMSINQMDNNNIILMIKYTLLYEENQYELQLKKTKMTNDDKFNVLYNQIKILTNKIKYQDDIKIMNNQINELKNIINEKNVIIDELSTKILLQEKILKEITEKNNFDNIINKINQIETKFYNILNEYKEEINNIRNNFLNDDNKQNNLRKDKKKTYNHNILNNNTNNIDKDGKLDTTLNNNNMNNNVINNSQLSIIKSKDLKYKSNEVTIKEILKEMNDNKTNLINKSIISHDNNNESNNNLNFNNLKENDFIIEENNININNYNYNYKINYQFKTNPKNLEYKMDITNTNTNWGTNDIFEVFLLYKDNKEYIASPNYINNDIDIYLLINNKKIFSLEGHKNRITIIRYFINKYNNDEYLISSDYNKILIVWLITNNYEIKYKINVNYGRPILSCLLSFPNHSNNFIISSTSNISEDPEYSGTKIYSLNDGKFIRYINDSNSEKIYYLISWYNKKNKNYYIIQCAYKKIIIDNLLRDELHSELIDKYEYYHYSGFIYNKDDIDYLCSSSSNGYIHIWNLNDKKRVKFIYQGNFCLFHIIKWNNDYIIVADYNNNSFKIINIFSGEIIKDFKGIHSDAVKCIKKVFHPLYGESLLSSGEDKTIKLWIIKNE